MSKRAARPAKRHALSTRIWHWINAVSLIVLFMSGLNISNAHRRLYWGDDGFAPADAWLEVPRFPGWATIPDFYSLAQARDWHVVFSLVFAFTLLAFMVIALINRHMQRDIFASRREWKLSNIWTDIKQHARLNFEHGDGKYNILQKIAYAGVILILLPLMIFTGMVMSPGAEAVFPWVTELFGGRQSARSLHFIASWLLFGFFVLHIVLVLLAGPIGQIRDMITGGRLEGHSPAAAEGGDNAKA
ncbi:cytochrome b/b6 domain-containing protein [Aurantiacibacter gangjinensis]|uniref:HupC n=1 Tax=Aurantiacibacter gangjinensis TaxID=502682 RepID=A0A0G9MTM5_9SPHN|nr:cytochrome b/b6 domain-containing protein [Aurantiacibacter gangjinensis]APE28385.1 Thiosulfate reductase cytochrome B subunit (membrane anchoring protein) [Aurantiacibacter gangjinensis]KLE32613.1 HupC [Aurantiacibacter gangjinensis]